MEFFHDNIKNCMLLLFSEEEKMSLDVDQNLIFSICEIY